jgi:hypothetical protein
MPTQHQRLESMGIHTFGQDKPKPEKGQNMKKKHENMKT